jgi:DNA-binding response OmpR family regulator
MSHTPLWRAARLVALDKEIEPAEFTLKADVCLIGRSLSCQVVAAQPIVSRLHATIERDELDRYILSDNNSANGTFINNQPNPLNKPHMLRNRDVIGLGSPEPVLRFEDDEATAPVTITRITHDEQMLMFFVDQQPLELTPNQIRLMQHLYKHAYDLCTRQSCAEALWEHNYDPALDDQALDRTISNLRQQLRELAPDTEFIITRRGVGYILVLNP